MLSMNNDILIRDARPEELDSIDRLVKEAYQEFRPHFTEIIWQKWMDNVSETVAAPAGSLIVAASGGVIHGVIKFYADASQSGMGHWPEGVAAIRILAVAPGARGRGFGTRLAAECLRRAREEKIATIFLFTGEFMHAARHIYEKLGFQRAPEFDPHPGTPMPRPSSVQTLFQRAPEFDPHPGPIAYRLDL